MTSPTTSSNTLKRVPIPKNGVDYREKVVLAPMVRSGELPSRLMALKYGADLVWGPETIDRALIGASLRTNPRNSTLEFTRTPSNGGRPKPVTDDSTSNDSTSTPNPEKENVIYRLHPSLESSSLIFQLGSASPDLAVQAATLVAPYVAGIDLNSGCPKPFSTSGGMGAALLSTPDLLCNILTSLVKEVGEKFEIGISVKIRLLATPEETRALVERLVKTGITGLTIHCRTRSMRKGEKVKREQLKMIGEICREAGVACLVNGDVDDRDHGLQLAEEFQVDGAMIATAAETNPSVFRAKADGGKAEWKEICKNYMQMAMDVENRWGNTKFLLAQMMPGKEQGKRGLAQAKNYEHVCRILELGEDMIERGRRLDEILGMTNRETKSEKKAQQSGVAQKGQGKRSKAKEMVKEQEKQASLMKRPAEQEEKSTAEIADKVVDEDIKEEDRQVKRQKMDDEQRRSRSRSPPGHSTEYVAEVRPDTVQSAVMAS